MNRVTKRSNRSNDSNSMNTNNGQYQQYRNGINNGGNNSNMSHQPIQNQQFNQVLGSNQTNYMPMIPQPALMASSSILTIGPFKHRKDVTRESVLSAYHIIGYIAAGTYGKVYKAKLKSNSNNNGGGTKSEEIDEEGLKLERIDGIKYNKSKTLGDGMRADGSLKNNLIIDDEKHISDKKIGGEDDVGKQYFAIKKFKSDNHQLNKTHYNHDINGNEITHYTGISQSAIREMSLCREISNKNITKLIDIILENKSICMVFEFCEHDLLQIIHYHSHPEVKTIPQVTIKSLIWQILNGVTFLHKNWIFHRDLKPANIMVTSNGIVKIGDLGLARKFNNPLQSLYTGDKVVVTIWYRAPELLLGARQYGPAIDLWAVGCILAELLSLRPIFKGEEAKIDLNNKKSVPFQKNQFLKIVEILGTPSLKDWPSINRYPEYLTFQLQISTNFPPNLNNWYKAIGGSNKKCLELLHGLLEYDPLTRLTSDQALVHPYFLELPKVQENAFEGVNLNYPKRRIYTDDVDISSNNGPIYNNNFKRHGNDENNNMSSNNPRKRQQR